MTKRSGCGATSMPKLFGAARGYIAAYETIISYKKKDGPETNLGHL